MHDENSESIDNIIFSSVTPLKNDCEVEVIMKINATLNQPPIANRQDKQDMRNLIDIVDIKKNTL